MEPTRLYLIRHGQVEGHERKRYNGQADVALTALGKRQAAWMQRRLAKQPLAGVYSSDLSRAVFTASLVAAEHGLTVTQHAALRELDVGDWQGLPWEELEQRDPEVWQQRLHDLVHFRMPGGESFQEAADRVRPALQQILARHCGEEIALVAHGGVNRVFLLDAIGAPLEKAFSLEQDCGCLNIIDYRDDGSCRVRLMNGPAGEWPESLAGPALDDGQAAG